MMRLTLPLVASAWALGLALPATAQDAAPSAADPAFSGPRVEGLLGWDRHQTNGGHDDGLLYGIGAGYDIAKGGLLVGVDGEASWSNADSCDGSATPADPGVCAKPRRDLYVGGRVGTRAGDHALLYAKAGYTNARFALTSDVGGGATTLSARDLDGVRVGAGAEYALSRNTYVKAEYRYSNYQDGVSRNQIVGGVGLRF